MRKFRYCEDGTQKIIGMRKAYRNFSVIVDHEQKEQGTTFESWLSEMVRTGIFVEV